MSTATAESVAATGRVLAVVGPTGVGKSELAERLARVAHGEIVSADSMQVYRGMDIGTAKTPPAERGVAYHGIDLVDPGVAYSAALYQAEARAAIRRIVGAGRVPVVVGGTGLYVRAALDEWVFPGGSAESPRRARLEARAVEIGPVALHRELSQRDPASARLIHPSNVRRTIRALEMAEEGASYAEQARGFAERRSFYPDVRFIGLTMEREALYARIDRRVDEMLSRGLLEEVRSLLDAGFRSGLTAPAAIGYKELVPVIEQGADLALAADAIRQATRRYAKRQLTWFRGDPRISWIDATCLDPASQAEVALGLLESPTPPATGAPAPGTWRLGPRTDREGRRA